MTAVSDCYLHVLARFRRVNTVTILSELKSIVVSVTIVQLYMQ